MFLLCLHFLLHFQVSFFFKLIFFFSFSGFWDGLRGSSFTSLAFCGGAGGCGPGGGESVGGPEDRVGGEVGGGGASLGLGELGDTPEGIGDLCACRWID